MRKKYLPIILLASTILTNPVTASAPGDPLEVREHSMQVLNEKIENYTAEANHEITTRLEADTLDQLIIDEDEGQLEFLYGTPRGFWPFLQLDLADRETQRFQRYFQAADGTLSSYIDIEINQENKSVTVYNIKGPNFLKLFFPEYHVRFGDLASRSFATIKSSGTVQVIANTYKGEYTGIIANDFWLNAISKFSFGSDYHTEKSLSAVLGEKRSVVRYPFYEDTGCYLLAQHAYIASPDISYDYGDIMCKFLYNVPPSVWEGLYSTKWFTEHKDFGIHNVNVRGAHIDVEDGWYLLSRYLKIYPYAVDTQRSIEDGNRKYTTTTQMPINRYPYVLFEHLYYACETVYLAVDNPFPQNGFGKEFSLHHAFNAPIEHDPNLARYYSGLTFLDNFGVDGKDREFYYYRFMDKIEVTVSPPVWEEADPRWAPRTPGWSRRYTFDEGYRAMVQQARVDRIAELDRAEEARKKREVLEHLERFGPDTDTGQRLKIITHPKPSEAASAGAAGADVSVKDYVSQRQIERFLGKVSSDAAVTVALAAGKNPAPPASSMTPMISAEEIARRQQEAFLVEREETRAAQAASMQTFAFEQFATSSPGAGSAASAAGADESSAGSFDSNVEEILSTLVKHATDNEIAVALKSHVSKTLQEFAQTELGQEVIGALKQLHEIGFGEIDLLARLKSHALEKIAQQRERESASSHDPSLSMFARGLSAESADSYRDYEDFISLLFPTTPVDVALSAAPAAAAAKAGVAAKAAQAASAERIAARVSEIRSMRPDNIASAPSRVRDVNGRAPINAGHKHSLVPISPELQRKYPNGVYMTGSGFPDFAPYATKSVRIEMAGTKADFARANAAAGLESTPAGHTWHHHHDGETMLLIPSDLHEAIRHTGGAAIVKGKKG